MIAPAKARPSQVFKDTINQRRMAALAMPLVTLEGGEMVISMKNVSAASLVCKWDKMRRLLAPRCCHG
jgi:hypothetical protein